MRHFLIAAVLLLTTIAPAFAELPEFRASYSANGWAQVDSRRFTGSVVQRGGLARINAKYGEHDGSVIVNLPGQTATFLGSVLPGMALKIAYAGVTSVPDFDRLTWLHPRKVGQDEIEGEIADRFALQGTAPDQSRVVGTLWVTPDGIPIAGVFNSGGRHRHAVQFRLSDISRGDADDSAFSPDGLPVKTVTIEQLQSFLTAIRLAAGIK